MTKREMMKRMISNIDGGKGAVVGHLGYKNESALNNRLYELKGQQFSFDDLLHLQELSGTCHLAQYCLPEGQVIVKEPSASECDIVELATIIIETQGAHGDLQTFIKVALSDDRLTRDEQLGIDEKKKAYIANLERQLKALKIVYGEE